MCYEKLGRHADALRRLEMAREAVRVTALEDAKLRSGLWGDNGVVGEALEVVEGKK